MARRRNDDGSDPIDVQGLFNTFQRLDPRAQTVVVVLLVVVGIIFAIAYFRSQNNTGSTSSTAWQGSPHLLLGNPSHATTESSNSDNYLLVKPYFAISYNASKGIPNWVSWRVTASDLGNSPRKEGFDPDLTLPAGFYRVTQADYNGSGFDRGHMCPHSDRAADQEMSFATFVMSNIIPQAPNVNRKAWEHLESYSRDLVSQQHLHLYITSGPAGQGGTGSRGVRQTLADGRVVVPATCWKIVVAVPDDGSDDDLAKLSLSTRVITVLMPNDNNAVGEDWAKFRTSPAQIEQLTGLHFFDRVRPDIAGTLRVRVDTEDIAPPRPHGRRSESWN